MDDATILKLNQLNQQFYQTVASSFDETRQLAWDGWKKLFIYLKFDTKKLSVLDVGCGNGRFGKYVAKQLTTFRIHYAAVDFGIDLLEAAKEKTSGLFPTSEYFNINIVRSFLTQKSYLDVGQTFDLIVLFGVLHHIPGNKLREELLYYTSTLLKPNGYLVFTVWNFPQKKSLMDRAVDPQTLGISNKKLEPNDHLLDWQRGKHAVRYCHWIDERELTSLIAHTQLKLATQFKADGPEHNLNTYVVLKKRVESAV